MMKELKLELSDGTELIWMSACISGWFHRWRPGDAVLLDEWDDEYRSYNYSCKTHYEMFSTKRGSVVRKMTGGVFGGVEYMVSTPDFEFDARIHDTLWPLIDRWAAGTLNEAGLKLLDELALKLDFA